MSQNYPGRRVAPDNPVIAPLRPTHPQSPVTGGTVDWSILATWTFLGLNVILFWALVGCAVFGQWSMSIRIMIAGACPLWVIFGALGLYVQVWQKRRTVGPA
jgi:hypothetical protein